MFYLFLAHLYIFGAGGVRRQLVLDLLSVHVIRRKRDNVLISFHPDMPHTPDAKYLRDRIQFAGNVRF